MVTKETRTLEPIDGYEQFFDFFSKDIKNFKKKFFDFGLKKIITIEKEKAEKEWKNLLSNINKGSNNLFIRNFGRDGKRNGEMKELYKKVFGIKDIKIDKNTEPTKLLQNNTDYNKRKNISNYQISHVFGMTGNVYCFVAPWNIVYIPKFYDPFTGHEAKGKCVEEFQKLFREKIFNEFKPQIEAYNKIMRKKRPEIKAWLDKKKIVKKSREEILENFEEIKV